MYMEREISLL